MGIFSSSAPGSMREINIIYTPRVKVHVFYTHTKLVYKCTQFEELANGYWIKNGSNPHITVSPHMVALRQYDYVEAPYQVHKSETVDFNDILYVSLEDHDKDPSQVYEARHGNFNNLYLTPTDKPFEPDGEHSHRDFVQELEDQLTEHNLKQLGLI